MKIVTFVLIVLISSLFLFQSHVVLSGGCTLCHNASVNVSVNILPNGNGGGGIGINVPTPTHTPTPTYTSVPNPSHTPTSTPTPTPAPIGPNGGGTSIGLSGWIWAVVAFVGCIIFFGISYLLYLFVRRKHGDSK